MAKNKITVIRITENDLSKMIVETAMNLDEGKWADRLKRTGKDLGALALGAGLTAGAIHLNDKLHSNDKPNPTEVEMKKAQKSIMKSKADAQKNDSTAKWPSQTKEGVVRFGKDQLCEFINRQARRLVEISTQTKQRYMDGQVAKKTGKRPLSQANLKAAEKYITKMDKNNIPHSNAKTPEEVGRLMAGDKASKVMQANRTVLKPTHESAERRADRIISEVINKRLKKG